MAEAVADSRQGGNIKQEEEPLGFFDSLDILATIATQELKSKEEEKRDVGDDVETGDSVDEEADDDPDGRQWGRAGGLQPKKLAEMEVVKMEQIKAMSANTLVRIFTETDFDEMKRMYCYTCLLMPGQCNEKFQSFGSESKAKKNIRQHLEDHVENLLAEGRLDFTAEPILARKRRIQDLTTYVSKPQPTKKRSFPIKIEPQTEIEPSFEKENLDLPFVKKHKEDFVPLLSEISNDQEYKRYKVKNESSDSMDAQMASKEIVEGDIKSEQLDQNNKREFKTNSVSTNNKTVKIAIEEDHCYAFKPGRVKAEYWPECDHNTATAFTSIQEYDETYDQIKQTSDIESVEAIQSCPVVLEEDYNYEESYSSDYAVQVETQQAEQAAEEVRECEKSGGAGQQLTTIVYAEQDPAEQFYTETIVTGVVGPQSPLYGSQDGGPGQAVAHQPRIKNKRTVAAVSSEDKRLALQAMEELRSRGATTEDLMCRLCQPPRPFTAYSTLLTHYRSEKRKSSFLIDNTKRNSIHKFICLLLITSECL